MGVGIQIESPRGHVVSSELSPGQEICIAGIITSSLGIRQVFCPVKIDVYDGFSPLHWSTNTNYAGWYWIDHIVLPNVVTLATVRVGASFLTGWEYAELPIGLGMVPPPPPGPGPGLMDIVKWTAICTVVILGTYYGIKLFKK